MKRQFWAIPLAILLSCGIANGRVIWEYLDDATIGCPLILQQALTLEKAGGYLNISDGGFLLFTDGAESDTVYIYHDGTNLIFWGDAATTYFHFNQSLWLDKAGGQLVLNDGSYLYIIDGSEADSSWFFRNATDIVLSADGGAFLCSLGIDMAEGNFTNVGTIALDIVDGDAGKIVVGDGDTVNINSWEWDISTTGAMTGIEALTMGGALTCSSTVNIDDLTAAKGVFTDGNKNIVSVGTLAVVQGGTGVVTLTDHGVLLGSGTSDIGVTGVGTAAQLLLGQSSADPTWNTMGGFATLSSTGFLTIATDSVGPDEIIATAVSAASYTAVDITVDTDGRITAASSGAISGSEITWATSMVPDSSLILAVKIDSALLADVADSAVVAGNAHTADLADSSSQGTIPHADDADSAVISASAHILVWTADLIPDSVLSNAVLLAGGTVALSSSWAAGDFDITALEKLEADTIEATTHLLITGNTVAFGNGAAIETPHADSLILTETNVSIEGNLIATTVGSPFVHGGATFGTDNTADTVEISGVTTGSEIMFQFTATLDSATSWYVSCSTDTIIVTLDKTDTGVTWVYFGIL